MIDSAEKRRSVIGTSYHYYSPGVTPNASLDQEWRQQSGHGYSGILADEPEIIVLFPRKHRIEFESKSASAGFSSACQSAVFSSDSQSVIMVDSDSSVTFEYILLESGDNLLLEDGQRMLREDSP